MKKIGLKIMMILVLIFALVLFLCCRYFFYSTWNVNYKKYMDLELKHYYGDYEFKVIDKKMNFYKEKANLYRFEYVATLSDGNIEFQMIKNMYDSKKFGGHWHDGDYWGFRNDYMRKKIAAADIDLSQYEIEFMDAVINDRPDYVFTITPDNKENIVKLITDIMRFGIKDYQLDLWFKICDPNGEQLTDSYDLFKACERADEEVNESNLEDFISDELDKF